MRWKNKKVKTKLRQNSNRKKINKNGAKKGKKIVSFFQKMLISPCSHQFQCVTIVH
jgi:hypothetical protein